MFNFSLSFKRIQDLTKYYVTLFKKLLAIIFLTVFKKENVIKSNVRVYRLDNEEYRNMHSIFRNNFQSII